MNKYLKTGVSLVILLTMVWGFFASIEARNDQGATTFFVLAVAMAILLFFDLTSGKRKPLSQNTKIGIVTTGVWILTLQLWGFIWEWHRHFDGPQFFVLHLAVPAVVWATWRGYRWVTASR